MEGTVHHLLDMSGGIWDRDKVIIAFVCLFSMWLLESETEKVIIEGVNLMSFEYMYLHLAEVYWNWCDAQRSLQIRSLSYYFSGSLD